jgi:hypothetical protein
VRAWSKIGFIPGTFVGSINVALEVGFEFLGIGEESSGEESRECDFRVDNKFDVLRMSSRHENKHSGYDFQAESRSMDWPKLGGCYHDFARHCGLDGEAMEMIGEGIASKRLSGSKGIF